MRIMLDLDGDTRVVLLGTWQSKTTLREFVARACGIDVADDEELYVDDERRGASSELAALKLLEGTRIGRSAPAPVYELRRWHVALAAGVAAGAAVQIPTERAVVVGRSPQADLVLPTESASWEHCTLELEGDGVRVRDAGSTNGTLIAGNSVAGDGELILGPATLLVGGAALALRPQCREMAAPAPGTLDNLTHAGTAPFNRPPRIGFTEPSEALAVPVPQDIPAASKFSFVAVLAPLAIAGILVAVLGDLRFAMFALLSPIMAIGMHLEQRRRRAKSLRDEDLRFGAELDALQHAILTAAEAEVRRRQEATPDLSVMLRRSRLPSTQLWHRRADQTDFLSLVIGVGDVPWTPLLDVRGITRIDDRVKDLLAHVRLSASPVVAEVSDAGVVGIVGNREAALALARSLLMQAALHCGPADLTVGVFCDAGRETEWDWAAWLPHTRQAGATDGARWMSYQRDASNALLRFLIENLDAVPTSNLLIVIDSESLTDGRESPARDLLGHGRATPGSATTAQVRPEAKLVSGIVLAGSIDQLPASCTTVIEVGQDAVCAVQDGTSVDRLEAVILAGLDLAEATECARSLARFEDPELVVPGATLPPLVRLPELLGMPVPSADEIRKRWAAPSGISTVIGVDEGGEFRLDLVADGPHGLVGGTTGSGKSEFLRSLVAGLAAHNSPDHLNFILIDFKGGAAFAACERLPHTIGTISNLDEQLADRALRALEAEMERRQRLFAAAGDGVDSLSAYLDTHPAEPLPRLLLVIDEFAMLAKEYPEVLASLVSVGAVGRTLGVHMILATQRPTGVVSDDILANTNLRVALRVQSAEDSTSVIGVPLAAHIGRGQVGRAYVKLGQDDITPVQTALSTGRMDLASGEDVGVRQIGLFGVPAPRTASPKTPATEANDLDHLIDAVIAAHAAEGLGSPRPVWPEALGSRVRLGDFGTGSPEDLARPEGSAVLVGGCSGNVVEVALADDPDQQRQYATGWDLSDGNLLLLGIAGSGTTTTLASLALSLAQAHSPDELDLLCLDIGSRGLAPLADLPHTVAYAGAGPGAREQQVRFLRHLRDELQRRLDGHGPARTTVILIDGLATLRDEYQDYEQLALLEGLYRAYAEGPSVGLHFAVSSTRGKSIPAAIDDVTTQRWIYRLADANDYAHFGLKGKLLPAPIPGRCVNAVSRLQMHIATPDQGLVSAIAEIAATWGHPSRKTDVVRALPSIVRAPEVDGYTEVSDSLIRLAVGLREDTLDPEVLELYPGEHALIAGPARSGKSTLLVAIAEVLKRLPEAQRPAVWGIHGRRSLLVESELERVAETPEEIAELFESSGFEHRDVVLLIDDAERVPDPNHTLKEWISDAPEGMTVIAAMRTSEIRKNYGHWIKSVQASGCGVLLQPDPTNDGLLIDVHLPKVTAVAMTVGRGYAFGGGVATFIQAISPSPREEV